MEWKSIEIFEFSRRIEYHEILISCVSSHKLRLMGDSVRIQIGPYHPKKYEFLHFRFLDFRRRPGHFRIF
ncbi:hypothetical protein [Leptospira adleri]|uniref:hypothetical protein n=1 Tax=Leptospira adleri TaxID=2023186 RepID=UPI000F64DF75|nr:hypothetical protein [Leptospira adleri]